MVDNNFLVFFMHDGMKFPIMVHILKFKLQDSHPRNVAH
jgi:catalase